MLRLLPFILIPILIVGVLGYWRFIAIKQSITPGIVSQTVENKPIEVPKTLPSASVDERIKSLEDTITKVVVQINNLKSSVSSSTSSSSSSLDARLKSVEGSIVDLTARVAALEKATPAPSVVAASGSKSTIYIPLGSGGTVASVDWTSLNTFQINLDPGQYPGYSSMQLEVNMRLVQPGGTLYARLYNSSSSSSISSEINSTSTSSSIYTSLTFTLPTGSKTYVLQAKTSDGSQAFLDTARIRVNF